MAENKKTEEFALLSWTRLKYQLSTCKKGKRNIEDDIKKLEEYLFSLDIKDIEIIYKSPDYYTLRYLKNQQTRIKQFLTEDIEKQI
ncbi:hypothetical protein [Thermohalobacter berrensis]|uniref:Uncharacterized protein n=1 Tax=Thermohalobacter berrensis TaxID=99594 RepID=A0A419T1V2_9FIRM|nr:hypothetical protein [Thermohalobacter berrensis]RKD31391.1 hypothetical protein BET03_12740 [Thermohalobacter berrensis]